MPTLYLDGRLTGFAKATKTCPAHKLYWRPLNWKRSLPVLKWTSESEYFLSFEKKNFRHYIQSKSNHFTPSAAHAWRGVIMVECYSGFPVGCPKIATRIRACAYFSILNPHQKCAHARILVAIFGQPTGKPLYHPGRTAITGACT